MKTTKVFHSKVDLIVKLVLLVIYLGSIAGFIVGLVLKTAITVFISGLGLLASVLAIIVRTLIKRKKLDAFDWIGISAGILIASILIIIYIFAIPEENGARTVALTVFSSITGGVFTLLAAGLTIKYNNLAKQEEEIEKYKPRVFPISDRTWVSLNKTDTRVVSFKEWKTNLSKTDNKVFAYIIYNWKIANSDSSMCVYDGFIVNGFEFWFDNGLVLLKGENYSLEHGIRFSLDEEIKTLSLLFTDMLDNTYKIDFSFEIHPNGMVKQILLNGALNKTLYIKNNKPKR